MSPAVVQDSGTQGDRHRVRGSKLEAQINRDLDPEMERGPKKHRKTQSGSGSVSPVRPFFLLLPPSPDTCVPFEAIYPKPQR